VYSTRLGGLDHMIGAWEPHGQRLIYVVVLHYASRDYRGRLHRDSKGSTYSVVDARTLDPFAGGGGDILNLRAFGRSVALPI
jgi:hypothetical protein